MTRNQLPFAFAPLLALAGCAGYAIDYTKPRTSIVGAELTRYGLDAAQSKCVGDRLATGLSVWQLRQLQIAASAVTRGYADPNRLAVSDLLWVAKHVKDQRVGPEVARAAESCGLSTVVAARPAPVAAPAASAAVPSAPAAAASATVTWINLGAATSGQMISVDATSLKEEGSHRSGWFRLTNPGQAARSSNAYLLRVDCTARTINSMALRKHGPSGSVTEQRDFGPNGEGAAQVEGGTVMEIAYLALCT